MLARLLSPMNRLLATSALCATLCSAAAPTAHAGATWEFFVTSIDCLSSTISGCTLDPDPVVEFLVPSDTSSGSASWPDGLPIFPSTSSPAHTGDDFVLLMRGQEITSRDLDGFFTEGKLSLRSYDLSWDISEGIINSIHISYATRVDDVSLGLGRGQIGSDLELGGCVNAQCMVTGNWVDRPSVFPFGPAIPANTPGSLPIPEPDALPLVLLSTGFFGLMAINRRRVIT